MKFIIPGIILLFLSVGCRQTDRPDVSGLWKEIKIGRLDKDIFALDTLHPDIDALYQKYGHNLDVYSIGVLQLGPVADSSFSHLLQLFIKDAVMREVADSVFSAYPDLKRQERELGQAWAYYRYYFPGLTVPEVYAHISGFNQSIVVDSAAIGIGLDNYLGENCQFYDLLAVPVPRYIRKKMTGKDIVRDAVVGWLQSQFIFRPEKNDLISGMIYQGKVIYVLEKLFPGYSRHWLLGFQADQWTWCEHNESQIWSFLIENEYVFSTQQRLIMKYLNDAPYTSGMPIESPGRALVWTGYRIVEKYMQKTALSLPELMEEQDYHKMLRVSGYRP